MSRTLARLLSLDSLLRSGQRQTCSSLATQLEVSERTIRSDIAFLRARFGAPLEYNRRQGHHYTDPDWRLPSVSLSKGELFALTLGARMLEAYGGSSYGIQLRTAISQLASRLPQSTWVDLQQLAQEHFWFRSGAEIDLAPDIWQRLEDACHTRRSVWMRYYTASRDCISERQFDPYLLHIYRGTNPYAIGYCHKRQDIRWFRVDRIRQLTLLEESFAPDPSFDRRKHFEQIFQHEAGGEPKAIAIWFDAPTTPFVKGRRWHSSQEIQEHPDGSMTLRLFVRGLNDLKRWVLGYGKGALVLEPQELVELVYDEVKAMNRIYQGQQEGTLDAISR